MAKYTIRAARKLSTAAVAKTRKSTGRKRFSSRLTADYALMLQLYYLHKEQAETKSKLKYLGIAVANEMKSSDTFTVKSTITARLMQAYNYLMGDNKGGMSVANN